MDTTEPAPQDPELELDLIQEKPVEDDAEARKARRAAILAKFQAAPSSTSQNPLNDAMVGLEPPEKGRQIPSGLQSTATPPPATPYNTNTGAAPSPVPLDGQFMLSKQTGAAQPFDDQIDTRAQVDGGVEGVAAADYDPSQDMRDDVRKAAQLASDTVMVDDEESEYEGEVDDDIDDMFAIVDEDAEQKPKKKKKKKQKEAPKVRRAIQHASYLIFYRKLLPLSRIQWTQRLTKRVITKSFSESL